MTVEEYAAAQAAISRDLVADVLPTAYDFQAPQLTFSTWLQFLELIFPFVVRARKRSAELGRRFYDKQREDHNPDTPRHDIFLAEYLFEWFVEAMEPARAEFAKPGASEHAADRIALRAMKETENAGRRTILRAVDTDDPKIAVGWARVATGRETCGFCMMLVSRGPVYRNAASAGLDASDTEAQELLDRGDDAAIAALMTRWHEGWDCKVVPVFDRAGWPGRDAHKRAEAIWKKTTKGQKNNRDAMNAFRRAIERGDVDLRAMTIAA